MGKDESNLLTGAWHSMGHKFADLSGPHTFCPVHGIGCPVDENWCCIYCGSLAKGPAIDELFLDLEFLHLVVQKQTQIIEEILTSSSALYPQIIQILATSADKSF